MKRAGQLAIILASMMLITIKCSGGVNPGQARDTHQAIALTAQDLEPASIGGGHYALDGLNGVRDDLMPGGQVPVIARPGQAIALTAALAAPAQVCPGLTPYPDLRKVGIPHHPGSSDIVGKIVIVAQECPPRSGVAHLVLEQYFPHAHKWGDIAGPVTLFLGGMTPGQRRTLGPVSHFCIDHTRFRLKMYGHGISQDGFYERFTQCYPPIGGPDSGKCFIGNKGGRYIHAC